MIPSTFDALAGNGSPALFGAQVERVKIASFCTWPFCWNEVCSSSFPEAGFPWFFPSHSGSQISLTWLAAGNVVGFRDKVGDQAVLDFLVSLRKRFTQSEDGPPGGQWRNL